MKYHDAQYLRRAYLSRIAQMEGPAYAELRDTSGYMNEVAFLRERLRECEQRLALLL